MTSVLRKACPFSPWSAESDAQFVDAQDGALCRQQPLPPLESTALATYKAASNLSEGVPCKYFAAAGFCANVSLDTTSSAHKSVQSTSTLARTNIALVALLRKEVSLLCLFIRHDKLS
jgi:hypothetical protein